MIECFPKRNCAGRFLNYRSPLICSPVERSSVPGALWDLADKTWVGDVAVTPRYRAVRKRYIRTRNEEEEGKMIELGCNRISSRKRSFFRRCKRWTWLNVVANLVCVLSFLLYTLSVEKREIIVETVRTLLCARVRQSDQLFDWPCSYRSTSVTL